eukprot:11477009-Karenia_brevis.AAC.1
MQHPGGGCRQCVRKEQPEITGDDRLPSPPSLDPGAAPRQRNKGGTKSKKGRFEVMDEDAHAEAAKPLQESDEEESSPPRRTPGVGILVP